MKQVPRWLSAMLAGVLLVLMATVSPAGAQTDYSSRSVPTTVTINDTAFADATHGVAVGSGGVISTTADAGKTWTARPSGTFATLFATAYWPAGTQTAGTACDANGCIWVAGADGTLLLSTDGGASFCPQTSGTTQTLNGIVAAGPDEVLAVGNNGTIILSKFTAGTGTQADECGAAANYQTIPSGTTNNLYDADIEGTAGDIYISGANGTILRGQFPQSSGAPALTVTSLTSGTTANLYGIASTSDSGNANTRVTAVGEGGTIVSTVVAAGAATVPAFTAQTSGTTQTLRDVELATDTTGFAVGDLGTILQTTDGGTTWTASTSGTCVNLESASYGFNAAQLSVASGERGTVLVNVADANATQPNCATTATGSNGYRMVAADGGIFTFGARQFWGSTGDIVLNKPIVGGATDTSDYEGYWIVASDGGVFTFSAEFYGSAVGQIDSPAVEIEPTPTGHGYWIVTAKGKVLPYGDAKFLGDMSSKGLNQPIIGMSVTATGQGYWLVGQDGGIFSFGDAQFFGSTGDMKLNAPVIDLAPTPDNQGYFLVAKDGGVFTFGSAVFKGSTGDMKLNAPVIAMLVSPNGAGYWLAATDGGIFTFGSVPFLGSMGGTKLNSPVLDLIN
jgi:photosystem II stability/assembly factor-like uncharacterized protein